MAQAHADTENRTEAHNSQHSAGMSTTNQTHPRMIDGIRQATQ